MHELPSANLDNRIPVKDDNDDPTNAILITGFSADKTYQDFNRFFRGIGNIRRCYLKKEPPRWCVVTFESNTDAKKACTSEIKTSMQIKLNEMDEITILPLKQHPEATNEALKACRVKVTKSRRNLMQDHHQQQPPQPQHPQTMLSQSGPPFPSLGLQMMQPPPGFFPAGSSMGPGSMPPPPLAYRMQAEANIPGVSQSSY